MVQRGSTGKLTPVGRVRTKPCDFKTKLMQKRLIGHKVIQLPWIKASTNLQSRESDLWHVGAGGKLTWAHYYIHLLALNILPTLHYLFLQLSSSLIDDIRREMSHG